MLSPNATNRVALIRGGAVTITANEQASLRLSASTALQVTLVDPIGNVEGLAGLQVIATGAAPPITAGAGYATLTACPSRDGCVWDAGQAIFGASGVGVGFVVDPPHAAAHSPAVNAPVRKRMIAALKTDPRGNPRPSTRTSGPVATFFATKTRNDEEIPLL
jgi:hypothetical protein